MKSNFFTVLKLAVVCLMLVSAAKQAKAQSGCTNPVDPADYSSYMSQCGTSQGQCFEACANICGGHNNCPCQEQCDVSYNYCTTNCYNLYCI
jgi:hypothetical protein